jgi:hypothetical protein
MGKISVSLCRRNDESEGSMNQELIDMAKQAHQKLVSEVYVGHTGQLDPWTMELLKIFAALVAAAEREACAKVCDEVAESRGDADECATEIRARGETE